MYGGNHVMSMGDKVGLPDFPCMFTSYVILFNTYHFLSETNVLTTFQKKVFSDNKFGALVFLSTC